MACPRGMRAVSLAARLRRTPANSSAFARRTPTPLMACRSIFSNDPTTLLRVERTGGRVVQRVRMLSSTPKSNSDGGDKPPKTVVAKGDRVSVRFKATDATTQEVLLNAMDIDEAVTFVVGMGQALPGLDRRIVGSTVGESWTETFEPKDAFGVRDPSLVVRLDRPPEAKDIIKGEAVQLSSGQWARVVELAETYVVVDMNHELAERQVTFEVKVEGVEEEPRNVQSGLNIVTLSPGDGVTFPQPGQRVTVHYTGTLASNGEEFDSSRRRGKPFSFVLGAGLVIRGWDVGIAKLTLGQRATIHIPSEMGYGSRGAGPIPPDATLVFDVELLEIDGKGQAKPAN